jgi:hypothetical protein
MPPPRPPLALLVISIERREIAVQAWLPIRPHMMNTHWRSSDSSQSHSHSYQLSATLSYPPIQFDKPWRLSLVWPSHLGLAWVSRSGRGTVVAACMRTRLIASLVGQEQGRATCRVALIK